MTELFKHTFVVVKDHNGKKYTIEIPKQNISTYRLRKIMQTVEYHKDFVSGVMKKDDVLNTFRMQGIACSFKQDFKVIRMEPKVRQEMSNKSVTEAIDIVLKIVSDVFKVDDTKTKSREQQFISFKEMFCYIARTRVPKAQWSDIAEKIGYKTHATAIHHSNKMQGWLDHEDPVMENYVEEIDRRIALAVLSEEDKEKIKEFKIE